MPLGTLNDLDGNASDDLGIQLFSVEFASNTFGDPFMSPEEGGGWGQAFSSLLVTVPEGEVIGGQVMVWAPNDAQEFSTGLGDDGIFLTDDDPVGPIDAGWTLVDLNSEPFEQIRDHLRIAPARRAPLGSDELAPIQIQLHLPGADGLL